MGCVIAFVPRILGIHGILLVIGRQSCPFLWSFLMELKCSGLSLLEWWSVVCRSRGVHLSLFFLLILPVHPCINWSGNRQELHCFDLDAWEASCPRGCAGRLCSLTPFTDVICANFKGLASADSPTLAGWSSHRARRWCNPCWQGSLFKVQDTWI